MIKSAALACNVMLPCWMEARNAIAFDAVADDVENRSPCHSKGIFIDHDTCYMGAATFKNDSFHISANTSIQIKYFVVVWKNHGLRSRRVVRVATKENLWRLASLKHLISDKTTSHKGGCLSVIFDGDDKAPRFSVCGGHNLREFEGQVGPELSCSVSPRKFY